MRSVPSHQSNSHQRYQLGLNSGLKRETPSTKCPCHHVTTSTLTGRRARRMQIRCQWMGETRRTTYVCGGGQQHSSHRLGATAAQAVAHYQSAREKPASQHKMTGTRLYKIPHLIKSQYWGGGDRDGHTKKS